MTIIVLYILWLFVLLFMGFPLFFIFSKPEFLIRTIFILFCCLHILLHLVYFYIQYSLMGEINQILGVFRMSSVKETYFFF